jgi:hypothetical protein
MNQDKKNNEKVIAKFEIAELTREELRTIDGGSSPVEPLIKPKVGDKN